MEKAAVISGCGKYRYGLGRMWGVGKRVMFIGLNPSIADDKIDDPTIRRCIGFAKTWGFKSMVMLNLFAFRATNPKDMMKASDPIGEENDSYIRGNYLRSDLVVAAWGTKGNYLNRDKGVIRLVDGLKCLDITKHGFPKHPLYVKSDIELKDYLGTAACNLKKKHSK